VNGSPQQPARILHLALVAGVVAVLAMFALLRRLGMAPSLDPALARAVARVAAVLVVVAVTASVALGRRRDRAEDRASGRQGLAPQLVRWVMIEGAALFAGIAWLLTGSAWALVAAVAGLATLALSGPRRGPA
jgi:hypothetical protein